MTSAYTIGQVRAEVEELLAKSERARDLAAFQRYRGNRARFAREEFGIEPWDKQLEALELSDTNRRVCIVSAHGVGKTLAIALEVLYQMLVCGPCLVICLSAVQSQMRNQIFGEIHKLLLRAKDFPGELYTESYRIDPATRHMAIGLGTNEPGRLTGYHHEKLVVIVDEAHGLPDQMWDAVLALAVGEEDRVNRAGESHRLSRPLVRHLPFSGMGPPHDPGGPSSECRHGKERHSRMCDTGQGGGVRR